MCLQNNEAKDKKELLKSRLEQLGKLLNYKNRNFCKNYLKKIMREFFGGKKNAKY